MGVVFYEESRHEPDADAASRREIEGYQVPHSVLDVRGCKVQ